MSGGASEALDHKDNLYDPLSDHCEGSEFGCLNDQEVQLLWTVCQAVAKTQNRIQQDS